MADSPDIRIGTAERETALQRLSDHFAAGRLSVAEFDERSAVISAAVTRADLVPVFADLPAAVAQPQQPAAPEPQRHIGRAERRGAVMGLTVLVAIVLFAVFHTWLFLLLIPAAAILLGPSMGQRDHGRRREERRQRRDRRRGR